MEFSLWEFWFDVILMEMAALSLVIGIGSISYVVVRFIRDCNKF